MTSYKLLSQNRAEHRKLCNRWSILRLFFVILSQLQWTWILLTVSLAINLYFVTYMNNFTRLKDIMDKLVLQKSAPSSAGTKVTSVKSTLKKKVPDLDSFLPSIVELNNTEELDLAERTSNIAGQYWERWNKLASSRARHKAKVTYCESVWQPHPLQLQFNNVHWQQYNPSHRVPGAGVMYLLNAYYDKRVPNRPEVKLISVNPTDKLGRQISWWCLLWFEGIKAPVMTQASYYSLMDYQKASYHSQIITCPVPEQHANEMPQAVTLQAAANWDCNRVDVWPSNVLRVIKNRRKSTTAASGSIGVCVQALRFGLHDKSVRLVEWLEMVRLLGADKVYFYLFDATEEMKRVLAHYEKEGLLDIRQLTLPGSQPNLFPLYQMYHGTLRNEFWPQELTELNDCLYRNLYRHDYITIIDIDEIIMPQTTNDWRQLIKQIEDKTKAHQVTYSSFVAAHSHVCEVFQDRENAHGPIPEYLYMMRHTYRSEPLEPTKQPKSIHRTDLVTAVHNHLSLKCRGDQNCTNYLMQPTGEAVLWHYRRNQSFPAFVYLNDQCHIHEPTVLRYYDQMASKVHAQLRTIFGQSDRN